MSKETIKNKFKNGMIPDENDFGELIDFIGKSASETESIPRDKSVTPNKTTFVKQSKNLFNKENAILDNYIAPLDGGLRPSDTWAVSHFIPLLPGDKATLNLKQTISFYRDDMTYINSISSDANGVPGTVYTATAPPETAYTRFSLQKENLDVVQFEMGEEFTGYQEYFLELDDEISVNAEKIKGTISELQIGFLKQTSNLLNPSEVTTGGYINYETGGIVSSPMGYGYSPYIPIEANSTYTLHPKRTIAFYDGNETFISGVSSSGGGVTADGIYTFKTPSNARYIRVTVFLENLERTMFNKGEYQGYKHFGKALPKEYMDSEVINDIENLKKGTAERKTIKILSFGNSFSQDAHQWLHYIAGSAGVDLILGNLSIAGQSLAGHLTQINSELASYTYIKKTAIDGVLNSTSTGNENTYLDGLLDEDWDIITLQQSSVFSSDTSSYQPHLNSIISAIKSKATNPSVKFALHQTWAYGVDQEQMYNQLTQAYMNALISSDIDILIPTGTAIQNARTNNYLNNVGNELTRDNHHLNYGIGRYIAGLTFFEVLLAKQNKVDILTDVSFYPKNEDQSVVIDGVDSSAPLAYLAKVAVKNAIQRPFKVTEF